VPASGFPVASRSRYRNPAAATATVVTGVAAMTAIGLAAVLAFAARAGEVPGAAMAATPVSPAATVTSTSQSAPPSPGTQASKPAAQSPGTVRLPKGGTAELVHSGIDSHGALEVPNGVGKAALWGAGLDAASGATLLAGHINWDGVTGPFAELWGAEKGQLVSVVDAAGQTHRYLVSEVLTLDKNTLPGRAADLFGQTGPHRLVLVTCGGQWVGGSLGYDQNRVVVAVPTA